jgi:exopolysaccharide biosynthesis polyprenyl glycosylphosphotransferase
MRKILLAAVDFLCIQGAFFAWSAARTALGFYTETVFSAQAVLSMILYSYWVVLFVFFGLYRFLHVRSRTDEFIDIVKTVSIGVFVIFLLTFDLDQDIARPLTPSRLLVLLYWLLMVGCVASGRLLLRTVHRRLLAAGYGLQRTVIVGWGKKAWDLFDQTAAAPALGYDIIGFVHPDEKTLQASYRNKPLLGPIGRLHDVVRRKNVHEVIIAIPHRSERLLQRIIAECNGLPVGMKIVPDLIDVIVGQVKTNQIYGFPLIEILPHLMPPWEARMKRLLDFTFSLFVLTLGLPFGLVIAAMIRIDSRGPVFFRQERIGRNGKPFHVIKFRSMIQDAERHSGPVWAAKNDPRVTHVGRVLRKLRIDEFPQLFNVLTGEMAIVGPRPERAFFVEKLKKVYPLYSRRLLIRPGITGWAQVKGTYDQTIEDVKTKLDYDLFYMENMSLRMDLKIILNTVYIMLRGKGH